MIGKGTARSRRRPRNALLAHDRAIVESFFRKLFTSPLDGFYLLALATVLVIFLRSGLTGLSPPYSDLAPSALSTIPATMTYLWFLRRLIWFRSESVFTADALTGVQARGYLLLGNFLAASMFSTLLFAPDLAALGKSLASWMLSAMLTLGVAQLVSCIMREPGAVNSETLVKLVSSRTSPSARATGTIVGAMLVALGLWLLPSDADIALVVVVPIVWCIWFAPIPYSALDFESYIGRSPFASVAKALRWPLIAVCVFAAIAGASADWKVALAGLAAGGAVIAYKLLEVLLVRALGRARTQFAMAVCLFGIITAVMVQPLLLSGILPVLGFRLVRAGYRRRWQLP
jgi:hypothetical protein